VRLPYAGESTIESRNDVSDAGSEASEGPERRRASFARRRRRVNPMFSCGCMSTRASTQRTHSRHSSP
jgi:hypothetical protein